MNDIVQPFSSEYVPIRSLLHIAITEHTEYSVNRIRVIVSDAISISKDTKHRVMADRRVYKYSSYLSKYQKSVICSMNPQHLTEKDFRTLLKIFEQL